MYRTAFSSRQLLQVMLILTVYIGATQELLSQQTSYYRHLVFRESPYSDTRGNHPIDYSTAKNEAHYRFDYDVSGRLVTVSHRLGDDLIADNGNWDSFIWFAPKMTIQYSEGKEVHHYFDHLNNQIEAHGHVYKAVFRLNNEGERTELRFYDKEGKPSESEWGIHQYTWKHLENGTIIEKRFNLKDEPQTVRPDFTFYTIRLEYGADELLDYMYHLDDEGNIINNDMQAAVDRIVYDQEENFSRWMVFNKDLEPAEGNTPEFAIGEHLYDCKGNKVELRGYDILGREKAMPNGVARILNTYDSFNNLIEEEIYSLKGDLLQRMVRQYSQDGKRVEWIKFLDEEGGLKLNGGGFAAIKIEYTDDGSVAEQKFYTADSKEVQQP